MHHHQYVLADAVLLGGPGILRRLCFGLLLGVAEAGGAQLRLHVGVEVAVDLAGAVRLLQLPQVLLHQRPLVAVHHHANTTRQAGGVREQQGGAPGVRSGCVCVRVYLLNQLKVILLRKAAPASGFCGKQKEREERVLDGPESEC